MKFLFVLKDRLYQKGNSKSYGLYNSAKMVADYLEEIGNECKLVSVIDGNFIDKEVYQYKPDYVIIEALWVTGAKMKELIEIPRYKHIKWVVRVHSDIGYLSAEGRALEYIQEYINLKKRNLWVSINNKEFNQYLSEICHYNFLYLPNIVTLSYKEIEKKKRSNKIDVASFGALRIMKNQMFQAMCAMKAADKMNKELHFHVNGDPINEHNPVLSNLKQLFEMNGKHKLHIYDWLNHDEFEKLIRKMDLGLQVSFSESFNIVTADFVNEGVNIVVSDCITWMPFWTHASTTNYDDLTRKIMWWYRLRNCRIVKWLNRLYLSVYDNIAERKWRNFIHIHKY